MCNVLAECGRVSVGGVGRESGRAGHRYVRCGDGQWECVYFVGAVVYIFCITGQARSLHKHTGSAAARGGDRRRTEQYGVHDASCGPKDAPPKIARMFSHIHMNAIASSTEHSSFGFKGKRIILRSPSTLATL